MHLRSLIQVLSPKTLEGTLDREITGIAYDSRRVMPGMLFVAITGRNQDGHRYIPAAIERGAVAVVCERNGFLPQRAAKIIVSSAREALAQASAAFYQHPSRRLKIAGITGTNGKTTVSFILKKMLETAGRRSGLIGTVRYEIGDRMIPANRTTPEALELQQMLSQMVRAGCHACVMEVSSHALDQKRVLGVRFGAAVFTNLTRDHLDYHGSMEEYYRSKRQLFHYLEGGGPSRAVINLDDPYGARLAAEISPPPQFTYGFGAAAALRAADLQLGRSGTQMTVLTREGSFQCRVPLIGRHNVYNTLAAVGAALALGVEIPAIQEALRSMEAVPGRLESVSLGQPFGLFVDYAHTDDALRNVLATLREITSGRLLLVFGCGGNRDPGKRPKMGRAAAEMADFTIITTDNPRQEQPGLIAAQIEAGFSGISSAFQIELDRGRAIEQIVRLAQPGDNVLIAGKGHETYQEFENTIIPFDDRARAQEALLNGRPNLNLASTT
jgi:UDP-N-acetylmuramoyl-L-alanyl-D-glutamate--2,6-diaminopimelate ligase